MAVTDATRPFLARYGRWDLLYVPQNARNPFGACLVVIYHSRALNFAAPTGLFSLTGVVT